MTLPTMKSIPRNKLRLEIIPELNKLGYGDIIPDYVTRVIKL